MDDMLLYDDVIRASHSTHRASHFTLQFVVDARDDYRCNYINVREDGRVAATDGRRLHWAFFETQLSAGVYDVIEVLEEDVILLRKAEPDSYLFPDIDTLISDASAQCTHKATITQGCEAFYLAEIIAFFGQQHLLLQTDYVRTLVDMRVDRWEVSWCCDKGAKNVVTFFAPKEGLHAIIKPFTSVHYGDNLRSIEVIKTKESEVTT